MGFGSELRYLSVSLLRAGSNLGLSLCIADNDKWTEFGASFLFRSLPLFSSVALLFLSHLGTWLPIFVPTAFMHSFMLCLFSGYLSQETHTCKFSIHTLCSYCMWPGGHSQRNWRECCLRSSLFGVLMSGTVPGHPYRTEGMLGKQQVKWNHFRAGCSVRFCQVKTFPVPWYLSIWKVCC